MNKSPRLGAVSLLFVALLSGTVYARGGGRPGGTAGTAGGGGFQGAGAGGGFDGGGVAGSFAGAGAVAQAGSGVWGQPFAYAGSGAWAYASSGSWAFNGGGIAGGGWHGGGLPGGYPPQGGIVGAGQGPGTGPLRGPRLPAGAGPGLGLIGFAGQSPGAVVRQGVPGVVASRPQSQSYTWYNGHWHNHWHGSGFGGYGGGGYPLGWGLGAGAMGGLWYNSGYAHYYNPYYEALPAGGGGYNYAQPIPVNSSVAVASNNSNDAAANLANAGDSDIDSAIELFRAGDYAGALRLVENDIQARPSDAAAHEVRALILFAMKEYSQAAAAIHAVLAIGPGWDWTTLCNLYTGMQVYAAQLHALEMFVQRHPRQADARFLLAYHYMTQGHTAAAASELKQVVDLMPDDKLAADLLRMVNGKAPLPRPAAAPPASAPEVQPVDLAALAGAWHASRDDGSTFDLNLSPDKTFTWKFSQQQHSETISGSYSADTSLLVLQGKTGAMVGQVTDSARDRFTFKPLGAPPDDGGLTFTR